MHLRLSLGGPSGSRTTALRLQLRSQHYTKVKSGGKAERVKEGPCKGGFGGGGYGAHKTAKMRGERREDDGLADATPKMSALLPLLQQLIQLLCDGQFNVLIKLLNQAFNSAGKETNRSRQRAARKRRKKTGGRPGRCPPHSARPAASRAQQVARAGLEAAC